MDAKSIQGWFIGYPKDSLGYYFYLPTEQVVVVSRDVIFFEKKFLQEGGKGRKIALEEESSNEANQVDQMDIDQESNPTKNIITPTPRRSSRVSHPPERYGLLYDMKKLHIYEEINHDDDPTTYEEALSDKDSLKWLEAMKVEMDSIYANQV